MTKATTYNYLHWVSLSNLINWSVGYLLETEFGYNNRYPLVPLSVFLSRNKTGIDIQDHLLYTRVTIRTLGMGITVRDKLYGEKIGTKKQFVIHSGQFLVSKIDARNGAFGVVPDEADGAVITGNFWTFDVDTSKINPTYLTLLTSTKQFVLFAEKASNGTTNRHYLQENLFLEAKIPLPSLEEQNAIVAAYNTIIEQSNDCTAMADGIDAEIEKYLYNVLGINVELNLNDSLLSFVHYKDISRWDPLFLLSSSNIHSKFQLVTLNDCINHFLYDENGVSLRIETKKTPSKEYKYIGMENVEKDTGRLVDAPIVKGKEIKSQTIKVPTKYFIYGKLRPYLNKYWYNDIEQQEEIICSSEFFVFDIKDTINSDYFKFVLASDIVQKQIADAMSGARMPRISENTFRSIQIPLPPVNIQDIIAKHIDEQKARIKQLKHQSKELKNAALVEFEKEIFE